jgi:hypothetical protein
MSKERTFQQKVFALSAGCLFTLAPILLLYAAFILALQVFFWLQTGHWYSAPLSEVFFPPIGELTLSTAPLNPLPQFGLRGTPFESWLGAPTQWVGVSKIIVWLLFNVSAHAALVVLAFVSAFLAIWISGHVDNQAARLAKSQPS